jgi:hypothetical protein
LEILIFNSSYHGFIQISVGSEDEKQTFDIHEYLITARSAFFKKALSGNCKEAEDRQVNLPEDDPDTFKAYVYHLYTNVLAVLPEPVPKDYTGKEEQMALAKVYVLAEKLQDHSTKDAVVQAMLHSALQTRPDGSTYAGGLAEVRIIYDGTPPGSPMRKLLVDLYTYRARSKWLKKDNEGIPSEFLHELAMQLLDKRLCPTDPTKSGRCLTVHGRESKDRNLIACFAKRRQGELCYSIVHVHALRMYKHGSGANVYRHSYVN